MTTDPHRRFEACLLGHALGDALGAPFEGVPGEVIVRDYGGAARHFKSLPPGPLIYTDDTQMMIGVAECLALYGRIDDDLLVRRFARNFEAFRGYGTAAREVLQAVIDGRDWRELARDAFNGNGSYGNGAAMRAGPIGLLFHHDRPRLDEEAARSALATHTHQLGMEGATLFAGAVASAYLSNGRPLDRRAFFRSLLPHVSSEEFTWQLRTAARMKRDDVIIFGSSLPAHKSVVSALCCFARHPNSFAGAVASAINLGDDTDTLAGMAGALVGARGGMAALPRHLLERLEDGPAGWLYIGSLAVRLETRWRTNADS